MNVLYMLLIKKKKDQDWDSSASHVTHQVGASKADDSNEPVLERKSSKVSFDEPAETKIKRQDSYTGVTRVSFEKPADLFVTSTADAAAKDSADAAAEQPAAPAAPAAEAKSADASNTGTAKRKKKKRDEVCCTNNLIYFLLFLVSTNIFWLSSLMIRFFCHCHCRVLVFLKLIRMMMKLH